MRHTLTAAALIAFCVALSGDLLAYGSDDGGHAAAAPSQDTEGLAALQRLAVLCPEPVAGNVHELRATVVCVEGLSWPLPATLTWTGDAPARLTVDGTSKAARQAESIFRRLVGLPLLIREAWSPRRSADLTVTSERIEGALHVRLRERSSAQEGLLVIGGDGLPTALQLRPPDDDPSPPMAMRLAFEARGDWRLLSEIVGEMGGGNVRVEIEHFDIDDSPEALDVPRRVAWTLPDGRRVVFVLYDLLLDGRRVAGTNPVEARVGRVRRVAPGAQRLLARHDAAMASLASAHVATAGARVRVEMPDGTATFAARWTSAGTCDCTAEPLPATASEFERGFEHGARVGFVSPASRVLCPPSEELWEYDAAAEGEGPRARVVLTPLLAANPNARILISFDELGRIVTLERHPRDGSKPRVERRTYERCGDGWVHVGSTIPGIVTIRIDYYVVDGFPPLLRSRRAESVVDGGSVVQTSAYSDWVIDGEPVPGTTSAE